VIAVAIWNDIMPLDPVFCQVGLSGLRRATDDGVSVSATLRVIILPTKI